MYISEGIQGGVARMTGEVDIEDACGGGRGLEKAEKLPQNPVFKHLLCTRCHVYLFPSSCFFYPRVRHLVTAHCTGYTVLWNKL